MKITKGTPDQFADALRDRISALGGEVEGCQVAAASKGSRKYQNTGTPEEFESALRGRISQLSNEGAQPVAESVDVYAAHTDLDDTTIQRYLHNLIGDVQDVLIDAGITSVAFDQDAENLYATHAQDNGQVIEYAIPFADLHFDFNDMIEDVDYVANAIIGINSEIDEELRVDEDIESAEDINLQVDDVIQADWYDDDNESEYEFVARKYVTDADGFQTEYTWYRDASGLNVFVFGDSDMYTPEEGNFDHEEEDDAAAREWFDSYNGFADDDEDDDWITYDADDIYSCDQQEPVEGAWGRDWYFGKEQADMFGDVIAENLSGKTISKRKDLAEEPGGLIYEANQLGIDMWDLLGALEGMCYQGRAQEIDDSTYKVM